MHLPSSVLLFSGMQRIVALVLSLIACSVSGVPVPMRVKKTARHPVLFRTLPAIDPVGAFFLLRQRLAVEVVLDLLKQVFHLVVRSVICMELFSFVSRRATSAVPFSRSRGPIAMRTGTP